MGQVHHKATPKGIRLSTHFLAVLHPGVEILNPEMTYDHQSV